MSAADDNVFYLDGPRPLAAGLEQTQRLSTIEGIQRSILVISLDKNFYKRKIIKKHPIFMLIYSEKNFHEFQVIQIIHSKDLKEMTLNFRFLSLQKDK